MTTTLRTERTEEVRHVEFRALESSDGLNLEGYAAVFGQWADIRDSAGVYREQILPTAFNRTLQQRTPVVQFDHGQHPLIGSIPLGVLRIARPDKKGLFVRVRLSDNWLIQPVRDAVRDEAVTGMSIRMRVVDDEWGVDGEGRETRMVKEVELLELGPVVFPAYTQTSVTVRSLMGALDEETRAEVVREIEEITAAEKIQNLLERDETGTSGAAPEPALDDDGPAEPPVASRDNHQTIQTLLAEAGLSFLSKGDERDVSE